MVCSSASWELTANLTDGIGSGVASVSINLGNGSLSTSHAMSVNGINVTLAFYNASCCSQEVELVAVDGVGNVGTCFTSIKSLSANTTTLMPVTITTTNGSYSVLFSMYILLFTLVVFLMW